MAVSKSYSKLATNKKLILSVQSIPSFIDFTKKKKKKTNNNNKKKKEKKNPQSRENLIQNEVDPQRANKFIHRKCMPIIVALTEIGDLRLSYDVMISYINRRSPSSQNDS